MRPWGLATESQKAAPAALPVPETATMKTVRDAKDLGNENEGRLFSKTKYVGREGAANRQDCSSRGRTYASEKIPRPSARETIRFLLLYGV
jgi:hypothetical protein